MTYREARSLQTLLAEVDAVAPRRSKRSDGWIGDAAHASRTSDHNPWVKDAKGVGVVRARDFTHDPSGGFDAGKLANHLSGLLGKHPALGAGAYVIWNRRIISASRLREGWRAYTGSNPHTAHVHLSVGTSGYDSTAPFGWAAGDSKPAARPLPNVRAFLAAKTRKARVAALKKVTGKGAKKHAQKWLKADRAQRAAGKRKKQARAALNKLTKG